MSSSAVFFIALLPGISEFYSNSGKTTCKGKKRKRNVIDLLLLTLHSGLWHGLTGA